MTKGEGKPKRALQVRYRPRNWDEVVGNEKQVNAFVEAVEAKEQHCFLLCGPSGVGKTTLARIAAKKLGCGVTGLLEIDGASYTGIDDMRNVQEACARKPFGAECRVVLVDECHRLSGNAWDSLLKITEEPPDWVYWFFCTTNPDKMIPTLKTRSHLVNLKPVDENVLEQLVEEIAEAENIELPEQVSHVIAVQAEGSARQALVYLDKAKSAKDYDDAIKLLEAPEATPDVMKLCRLLCSRGNVTWSKIYPVMKALSGQNAEGIRIIVCNYVAKALEGQPDEKNAQVLLNVLFAFSQPYNSAEKQAPLYLSVGRVIFP